MRSLTVRLIFVSVLAALAIALLAGCKLSEHGGGLGVYPTGKPSPTASPTPDWDVSIADLAFSPQSLTVEPGADVTWKNIDSRVHTVTSADGGSTSAKPTSMFSVELSPGQTFSFTFTEAGVYYYQCTIYANRPAMHGRIVVE